ncbi:hypothetical protein [Methylosarcina fibrata]|uniref:hypothetical protein n=1 Tax=Methylosarcina fibrata TaxID=105972 RepID=UPI0003674148|nr:hypothetical protein [Methylosarcina fibrata]
MKDRRFSGLSCALAATIVLAFGCASQAPKPTGETLIAHSVDRKCGPASEFKDISGSERYDEENPALSLTEVSALSPATLDIANIIGVTKSVEDRHLQDGENPQREPDKRIQRLQVREQLAIRILQALLAVKSAAAEADCEEERAADAADRLQDRQELQSTQFTVLSLLGSGLGGALSGGLSLGAQAAWSAIAGIIAGVTEAAFGTMALSNSLTHEFSHERNILKEIWDGPKQSRLFPRSVWRFLNRPLPEDSSHRSLRETLIARWRHDGRLGEANLVEEQHRIELFFGAGGLYSAGELRDRAVMLDMVESDVNLMSHDLEYILDELLSHSIL